ncbi:HlyD family efflux transporter periplasmic adaptor subunit [Massilia atriviolacea]|uniref:HlyD family efflux transporter periplasmic adaptor subunit n=1 Tax=Massilia atriviolacea TaxID=2495579 RepID=A0A430HGG4_9BURK|nr:HlyD family efflux transporter periplasmic adaptor subunit [Massilia atriviolacea]RSZ56618.1 HlyD family efflux transporter periplasmic adaptor subunit [Massilia atriviolacea]
MALPEFLPPLRDDIDIFPAGPSPLGTPSWRLYDPLRNRFFQIGEAEFQMLAHWHLGSSAAALAALQEAMPLAPDAANLEALLLFLHRHQLLARRERTATAALATLAPPPTRWGSWLLHNYLFLRVPLANPDRFYGWLAPRLAFMFRPGFWIVIAVLGLIGLGQVMMQPDRFFATFSYAFSIEGALWIALSLALLKSTHEVGHGVAAKRQGLRVTRTGVALLVLWPVLYTDVNDIWKLSDWRARLQVSVAGIATELVFAVLATWGWLLLPEGPLQSAMFIIAGTAWVLSLAINLNPFMRFDGYYLLSDLLDYPNLQEAAFGAARSVLRRRIGLAEPPAPHAGLPVWALAGFGFGTALYRLVLFLGIAYFVFISFPPLIGVPLAAVEIGWFIVKPVATEIAAMWPRRAEITRRRRRWYAVGLAGLLLLAVLPWSARVEAPAYLTVAARQNLFVPASAQVRALHVRNGQQVKAGEVVLELASPELANRLVTLEARIREAQARLDKAATNSGTFDQSEVLQQTLAERMVERDSVQAEIARLTVRATRNAVVRDLPAHIVAGRWLRMNEKIATLLPADGASLQAVAYVREADYRRVQSGAPVRFFPDGDPLTVMRGRVRAVGVAASSVAAERALTSLSHGPLPAVQTPAGERLHGAFYAVDVSIEPQRSTPGRTMTGSVRIVSAAHNPLLDRLTGMLATVNAYLGF